MKREIPKSQKMLIVLMFWEGDKAQAMSLARLLSDLEEGHSTKADLLFVHRFDCSAPEAETVRHVSRKFNVFVYRSKRRGVGWPSGCNSIFFGGLEWVYHKMAAKQIQHYKAIIGLGADSAPIEKNWLERLHQTWETRGNNGKKKIYVGGALVDGGGRMHINGDCILLSTDLTFLKWLAVGVGDITVPAGWDWVLAEEFQKWGWENIKGIRSWWQRRTPFTETDWEHEKSIGTIFFHGQKDNTLLELARKKLV